MHSLWRPVVVAILVSLLSTARAATMEWQPVHRGVASEAPECVSWADDRVDCLVRTFGNGLSWVYVEAGGWNLPRNLGGELAGAPSCVTRGPFNLDCFAISVGGELATVALKGSKWSRWSRLGGELAPGRPSCVAQGMRHIACFARSEKGTLMAREWTGGTKWNAWTNLGGNIAGDPSCVAGPAGEVACFMRGTDGHLRTWMRQAQAEEAGWTDLGASVRGRPSCASLAGGDIACLSRAKDNRSMVFWQGNLSSPGAVPSAYRLPARNDGEPACWHGGSALSCTWRSEGSRLVAAEWSASAGATNMRELKGDGVTAANCLQAGVAGTRCIAATRNRNLEVAAMNGQPLALSAPLTSAPAAEPEKETILATVVPPVLPRAKPAVSSRVQLAQAPATVMSDGNDRLRDIAGAWKVVEEGSRQVCRLELTSMRRSGGYALQSDPACPRHYQRAEYWNESASSLVLVGSGHVVVARFLPAGRGRWRANALKGVSLVR